MPAHRIKKSYTALKTIYPASIAPSLLLFVLLCPLALYAQEKSLDEVLFESSELLREGKPEDALTLLNQTYPQHKDEPEFLNNLAIANIGNNEPDEALRILRNIVDQDPMFSIVAHNLIEMELGAAGAIPDQLNPILFVQSVNSFEHEAATSIRQNDIQSPEISTANASLLVNALTAVVQSWSAAWSQKDFDRYISHYANDFQPNDGSTRSDWLTQRRDRLAKPGEIKITISNLTIISDGTNPLIEFDQAYRSETYSDKTLKEMSFTNDNDRWKINTEKTIKTY